jgi:hypothetical protein
MNLSGAVTLSHLHQEAILSAGDAVLISNADSLRMERTRSRRINIALPRAVLAPMLTNADAAVM